jgi:hypothetical protein
MNFDKILDMVLGEASQGTNINYIVNYNDKTVLGYHGEAIPESEWYLGMNYESAEEANRWAAEKANGRLWRLLKVNVDSNDVVMGPWVTSAQAAEWSRQQSYLWDPSAPHE